MAELQNPTVLPPAQTPVLDGNNNFTLPWRRALQRGPSGLGGITVTPTPTGPVISLTNGNRLSVRIVPDATYTLSLADSYTYLLFTGPLGCVVTVPSQAAVEWPDDPMPVIALQQGADFQVEILEAPDVAVNTLPIYTKRSFAKFGVLQLARTRTNAWTLLGAQEPA